ncbi:hypothetical protein M422DRAFT_161547, partial [Sphaerobolus stellatus SS14]
IAGHETTSSALVWLLYELARHPEAQNRLRKEIKTFRAEMGGRELASTDFDLLPYTTAVIKETLRFYPIITHNTRKAGRDETIPLSNPIRTRDGKLTNEISVRKGQMVLMPFWVYNRLKELWGNDADKWNPERFIGNKLSGQKHNLGVYSNLSTFGSGVHNCIGHFISIAELYSVLTTLIEKFEVLPPPDGIEVYRASVVTMVPMIKGQEKKGVQMPLTIRPL